jgi:hypothetical protein
MGVLTWNGNLRITSAGSAHSPQTSHGPALAVLGDILYAVYVGGAGANLWFMRLQPNIGFDAWQDNQPIKVDGVTVKSSYRPALAVANGMMHMVYQGAGGTGLWWSWFDGEKWWGNIKLSDDFQLPFGGKDYSLQQTEPSMCVDSSGTLHLAYHAYLSPIPANEAQNQIFHSTYRANGTAPSPSNWSKPDSVSSPFNRPEIQAFNRSLFLIAISAQNAPGSDALQLAQGLPGNWSAFSPIPGALSNFGGALVEFNTFLYAFYRGQGNRNVWYVCLNPTAVPGDNKQVKGVGINVETSAPISVAVFNGEVCLAYKGQSSDNFWFAHGA